MSVGFAMKASLSGCFPSKVVAFRGTNCVTSQEEAVHGGGGSRNLISEENLCGQYQELHQKQCHLLVLFFILVIIATDASGCVVSPLCLCCNVSGLQCLSLACLAVPPIASV